MNLPAIVTLLRPHHWIKNAFVSAPLFFTPAAVTAANIGLVIGGIIAFCAISSAAYIVNDYFDREADRAHPAKQARPLVAGTVSTTTAFRLFLALLVIALLLSFLLMPAFAGVVLFYLLLNLAYSVYLKHVPILDVVIIAFGFILRVEGGGLLVDVAPTQWIIIMTGLLALFLGLAKRRDDLIHGVGRTARPALDGYTVRFVEMAGAIVTAALLVMLWTAPATGIAMCQNAVAA